MSLRGRLMVVVVGLVAVGLAATDLLTYRALRSFLLHKVDQQLVAAKDPVVFRLIGDGRRPPLSDAVIPSGTVASIVDSAGTVLKSVPFVYEGQRVPAGPALEGADLSADSPFTVGSEGGGQYRVLARDLDTVGDRVVIAIPLSSVTQTLHRLVGIEALATVAVLVLVGVAALWLVKAGLRPLEDIGEVAGAIADGDLSKRVAPADPRTEVGRLGLSLNAMLGQIESAFEARQASEARLRRFVADASHELRTPLTSIRGYAELFRRGAAERPEDLAKAMRRIEEESARMGVLVDDLLLLARLDQGRPLDLGPVDLARLAADAVDDARAVDPGRRITLDAAAGVVVKGDDARLRQVAANLLANAMQHTRPEVAIEVTVGIDDGAAVLEVADHGPGLYPEEAAKVFERFYRADASRARAGGGSGLGLSIVTAIAAAHGGKATVASEPGQGARFRVSLPLEPGGDALAAIAPAPVAVPSESS